MKLLYLWVENHNELVKNQSFKISNSYHINFDLERNILSISKNKEYIENFYGNNILDVTAIVGRNGTGKTTIARSLYRICDSVNPVDDDEDYPAYITKHIVIYEVESQQEGEPSKLIIHYFLSKNPGVEITEDIVVNLINLKYVKGDEFKRAEKQHNMTMIYFTNAFEVNNVLDNQGFSEFSSWGTHKSLAYTPMLSLHRAFIKLREHYGSKQSEGGMIVSVIEQYAKNMTNDFKTAYATAQSYNYMTVATAFQGVVFFLLPEMKDFKIKITEFGHYIKFKRSGVELSKIDWHVMFIRENIYEKIISNYKKYHWEQLYVNIICEIALFVSLTFEIDFKKMEQGYASLNSNKAFDIFLGQIEDNEEDTPKKELIRRIKYVQGVDLSIIKEFIELADKCEELNALGTSTWFKQIQNFLKNYNKISNIKIGQSIDYKYLDFVRLITKQYNNEETVYGRMINIIPPHMSSGEVALINIFAMLYSALKTKTSESILLIIDEIDAFLHPKWQQQILTYITEWINREKGFKNKKVQLVVATHSPIILSDIPRDNIIYLKEPFEVYSSEQLTFGANISTLFYDSFFMEKGSIGAIARKEIQWVIDNIENTNLNLGDRKRLVYIINNIGDKFLRENLKSYPIYIEAAKQGRDDL